ncbi:hypothetical protein [Amycolatopsis sp. H20-H5]|uniref:hypothetical protein n=1 Tax=Amycolatopsis sp. H20-H5 TaxID=3046309 RepID=UPI002DB71CDA|nr:hypothetical protein [Amycolatopsis sp. H20-H5]MEC3979899.1 hypothetical protein [Amycolatopsis sp. H20-H5]
MPAHTPRSPSPPPARGRAARVLNSPPSAPGSRHQQSVLRRMPWCPRGRRGRLLAVAAALSVTVLGVVASASATPGPSLAAAAMPAPKQPPPVPVPPDPSCAPGSAEPVCNLPTTSPSHTIPASPLPPITTLPGPDPSCFPGSILPGCGPIGSTPTSSTAPPCAGPNCIPQPTTLNPSVPPVAPIPGSGAGDADCGFTDLSGCMINAATTLFATVVAVGLTPLLDLLGNTLLTTPEPDDLPSLGAIWTESWHILLTAYVILVLLAGMILMAYETLQARYTVKELAPRLVVGFLAGTLSLFLATKGIQIANALSHAVMGEQADPATMTRGLITMVQSSLHGGGLFIALLGVGLIVMLLVLLVTFIVRVILTILLIAAAPIALMFHALPHTEGIAHAWWRSYAGALAVQVAQSLTLVVGLKIFFAPGGFTLFGPTVSAWTNLLLCIALMYVLIKIPFWFLSSAKSGKGSMLGRLVRGVIVYKTMGLLGGAGGLLGRRGGKRGGTPRTGGPSAPADPPSTQSGQYMLPLKVRRVSKPFRTRRRGWDGPARPGLLGDGKPGPGQLSLFTTSGHSGDRTVGPNPRALPPKDLPNALPRDQLGLPLTVRHDPHRTPPRTLADDLATGRPAPVAMRQPGLLMPDGRVNRQAQPPANLPRAMLAPSTGMLPIHLPPQTPRAPRRTIADQLADPSRSNRAPQTGPGLITPSGQINRAARASRRPASDAYTGNRPLASGQYPLPLGVRRQAKPAPADPPPAPRPARPTAPKKPAGRQLPLPLDLPARPRRPKKK